MAHVSDLIAHDIEAYLEAHEHKSLLRFITCGSVDDGKSTLIGRLLYDSKMLFEDQLAALEADSKKVGTQGGELDFALLVDGLAAEREQGITIDVAYRFFSTDKRKFIVADTPGHEQYTRNMVTGASTADLAVILIDARKGVLTQTRRHSYLVSLLGIRHVVLAVNKMDLVDYSQDVFDAHRRRTTATSRDQIGLHAMRLRSRCRRCSGDNITDRERAARPGTTGPTLMGHLETVEIDDARAQRAVPHAGAVGQPARTSTSAASPARSPAARVRAGRPRPRPAVGQGEPTSRASSPWTATSTRAVAGQSVTLTLADEIDVSRGDVLAAADAPPGVADQFEATIVWMSEEPMLPGRPYLHEDRRQDRRRDHAPRRSTRSTSTRSSTWRPRRWS